MRIVVLILALQAAGINAFISALWSVATSQMGGDLAPMKTPNPPPEVVAKYNGLFVSSYLLLGASALCLTAGGLAMMRKGKVAALTLLLAAACSLSTAALLHNEARSMGVVTAVLPVIVAGLAFLVRPAPAPAAG
jgi:hypothetical protein